eukprot:350209-Chlamydomonas_euryale.AAC.2
MHCTHVALAVCCAVVAPPKYYASAKLTVCRLSLCFVGVLCCAGVAQAVCCARAMVTVCCTNVKPITSTALACLVCCAAQVSHARLKGEVPLDRDHNTLAALCGEMAEQLACRACPCANARYAQCSALRHGGQAEQLAPCRVLLSMLTQRNAALCSEAACRSTWLPAHISLQTLTMRYAVFCCEAAWQVRLMNWLNDCCP